MAASVEIQQNRSHRMLLEGALALSAGAGALLSVGAVEAHQNHNSTLDSNTKNTQTIKGFELANQVKVGGVNYEVKGLPEFKTAPSSQASADYLASKLGSELSFVVPAGSNVNNQIHNEIQAKTGADLNGAQTWEVVNEVGAASDNLVMAGEQKSYPVTADAITTIQGADVQVTAPDAIVPSTSTSVSADSLPAGCIATDLKGHFDFINSSTNTSGDPATIHLQNVQPPDRQYCPKNVWIRAFGSNDIPNSPQWLAPDHQQPIIAQISYTNSEGKQVQTSTDVGMISIPDNTNDLPVVISVGDTSFCNVQIDALRTDAILNPPTYNGTNMIDFAIIHNPKKTDTCQDIPTPTATNTATPENTATATVTMTPEATATSTAVPCIDTDVKGELDDLEDSNHLTGSHVTGKLSNIAKNPACSNDIYIHMYGSMDKPTGTGQNIGLNIESQTGNHILTKEYNVPQNTVDMPIAIDIPQNKFCTVQVDLTRDGVIKDVPRYIDNDFLLFVNEDNCNPKTATATATATSTQAPIIRIISATPTNSPEPKKSPTPTNTPVPPTEAPKQPAPPAMPKTGFGPEKPNRFNSTIFAEGLILAAMAAEAIRRAKKLADDETYSLLGMLKKIKAKN